MTVWPKNIRRFAAIALLLLALGAMAMFALWPQFNRHNLQTERAAIQAQLDGYEIVMAEGEDLSNWNNFLKKENNQSRLLLSGATEGIAGAALQELILKNVTRNGGLVSQVQVLPPRQENELTRIPVNIELTTNTRGLRDIIFDLETNHSLLFISKLIITPVLTVERDSRSARRRKGPMSLKISMQIFGYVTKASPI